MIYKYHAKMKKILFFLSFSLIFLISAWSQAALVEPIEKSVVAPQAMVVSPHPLATQVGIDILKRGGNAVDAAVAVQFAMAVVFPRAGNLGGGGLMVLRQADGTTAALDYREKAPAKASRDMYLNAQGEVEAARSTQGHLAAGVPGTVAGMAAAQAKYGKLPLADLVAPAVELAEKGFALSQAEADRFNTYQKVFAQYNADDNPFLKAIPWQKGDILIQKNLAQTLRRISEGGAAGFYRGTTAKFIAAEMKKGTGLISKADLRRYTAVWREPVTATYKNYRVIAMPPPSSGGIALLQLLKMMEPHPLASFGFQSPAALHLMTEAERRVYADRAQYLGDPDFFQVPIDSLLNAKYLLARMRQFDPAKATPSKEILAGDFRISKESFETEHTSVVDAAGNAVAVTTTLNSNFGNKVLVHGAGFFLNNEMDDFSAKVGVPNQFGLVGAEANAIAPGKRMLSSMTPTILEKDGQLFLVIGAPGGSTIITAVFQVILNVIEFGMPLDQAIAAGRVHHQWLPDEIWFEKGVLPAATREALQQRGHRLREVERMAVVKAILRLANGQLHGAADPRNPDDAAQGY